jgi:hypothetical protein
VFAGSAFSADALCDEQAGQRAQTKADAENCCHRAERLAFDAISRLIRQVFSGVASASGRSPGRSDTVFDYVIELLFHSFSRYSNLCSGMKSFSRKTFLCDFLCFSHTITSSNLLIELITSSNILVASFQ